MTVQWLLDTFHGGRLLSEAGYLHPESLPPAPPAVSVPARSASTSRATAGPPAASPPTPTHARAEEDLLSQYMDDDQTVGRLLKNLNGMRNIHFFITASLLPPLSASWQVSTSRGQLQCSGGASAWIMGTKAEPRTRVRIQPAGSQRGETVFWKTLPPCGLKQRGRGPNLSPGDGERRQGAIGLYTYRCRLCSRPTVGLPSGGHGGRGGDRHLAGKTEISVSRTF